jgi:hypothetical protein
MNQIFSPAFLTDVLSVSQQMILAQKLPVSILGIAFTVTVRFFIELNNFLSEASCKSCQLALDELVCREAIKD